MKKRLIKIIAAGFAGFFISGTLWAASVQNQGKKWKVIVSIGDQKTYVYEDSKLERVMICSTGLQDDDNDTPTGNFILDESRGKREPFFFSEKVGEGAELGKLASHGCIRLSVRNAYWFYKTVPDGADIQIQKGSFTCSGLNLAQPLLSKSQVTTWLFDHESEYFQQHLLSCEAAATRLVLAIMGIRDLDEDTILYSFPWGKNPETSFVCDNVDEGRRNKDGSIHWNNYGTHPPVIVKALDTYMKMYGLASLYEVKEMSLSDAELKKLAAGNDKFLGAIVWLVGHPERWGTHPAVKNGIVLGEHVRFVDPELDTTGKFMIWDIEKHPAQPYRSDTIPTRDMFNYRTVVLFKK